MSPPLPTLGNTAKPVEPLKKFVNPESALLRTSIACSASVPSSPPAMAVNAGVIAASHRAANTELRIGRFILRFLFLFIYGWKRTVSATYLPLDLWWVSEYLFRR